MKNYTVDTLVKQFHIHVYILLGLTHPIIIRVGYNI